MLVLTRKNRESVVVGDNSRFDHVLKVTVLDVRGGKVRLGFQAHADVPIHRWEVWQRIRGGQGDGGKDSSSDKAAVRQKAAVC
jgi:carbon storage regulator